MKKPTLSLDELAAANQSEFDQLFATRMALSPPIITDGVAQAPIPDHQIANDTDNDAPSVGPHIATLLTNTYANGWSYEIVEHEVGPRDVRVLCRLTAMDQTRMQFGTAVNDGNIGIALQRATDDALARCHADLAPETQIQKKDCTNMYRRSNQCRNSEKCSQSFKRDRGERIPSTFASY